jgi:hypothetical protein
MPFASGLGMSPGWEIHPSQVPMKSLTRRFNAGGKVLAEERGVKRADDWFSRAEGEIAEEVIELGR